MPLHRNKTSYDIGREEGRSEGVQEGRTIGVQEGRTIGVQEGRDLGRRVGMIELLEAMLQSRFGVLSESRLNHLRGLSDAELRELAIKIPGAVTLAELGLPSE